ncbi:MAG: hypothetical protein KA974_07990 [Saprospiraceae bacterium]|nr:hypothetical protein [Saprospiraceae bacterium]MBP7699006.1 hypothetical protein [Saprospiraceae bacterium]
MIGDKLTIKKEYYVTAQELLHHICQKIDLCGNQKTVILIAGESGSGKSVSAVCLAEVIQHTCELNTCVFHMDDYFKLPPKDNHEARIHNLQHVGLTEVDFDKLQQHLNEFKLSEPIIQKPLVFYDDNVIAEETIDVSKISVLIIEGTYAFALQNADYRIFMMPTYIETKQQRLERARESDDLFIEKVLAVEHQIVTAFRHKADVFVHNDYSVTT